MPCFAHVLDLNLARRHKKKYFRLLCATKHWAAVRGVILAEFRGFLLISAAFSSSLARQVFRGFSSRHGLKAFVLRRMWWSHSSIKLWRRLFLSKYTIITRNAKGMPATSGHNLKVLRDFGRETLLASRSRAKAHKLSLKLKKIFLFSALLHSRTHSEESSKP